MFSIKYFPKTVISSHVSFDLSHNPKSDICVMLGGPKRSKEQSLPAKSGSHVQLPTMSIGKRAVIFNMIIFV